MFMQRLKWRAVSAISSATLRLDSSRERFTWETRCSKRSSTAL